MITAKLVFCSILQKSFSRFQFNGNHDAFVFSMLNKNRGNAYKEFDNTQNPKLRERFIWQTPGCFRNPDKCKRLSYLVQWAILEKNIKIEFDKLKKIRAI